MKSSRAKKGNGIRGDQLPVGILVPRKIYVGGIGLHDDSIEVMLFVVSGP
jgi:hypothetical protein